MTLCPPIRHMALVASLFVAFALMPAPRAGAATAAEAQSEAANSQAGIDNWALPSPKSTSPKSSSPKKAVATPLTKPALPKPIAPISTALKSPPAKNGGLQIQGLTGSSVPWSIVIMLTALTLIPSLLLCVTPFARLLIVFHFLRQALGLQTTPSNQTLIGLSMILTFFLMHPVATQIFETAVVPAEAGQITPLEALKLGEAPLRKFMTHYVRDKDVALFVELAKEPRPASVDDLSMHILLPAYILSELKAGFQIGTVLFLPFLIVDMVVASITTSVGMLQLPPVVISTPLKLLLFLMVDGWHLLIGSLMRSFN
jgi:flagellar biosynthetic protein FliP